MTFISDQNWEKIAGYVTQAENFAEKVNLYYSENAKSDNKNVQKAIDWAPSIIMGVGMYVAPYLAVGLSAVAIAIHIKKPKIITIDAIKNVLLAATFATGANSVVPTAKAIYHSTTAIAYIIATLTLGITATNLEDVKQLIKCLKMGEFKKVISDVVEFTLNGSASIFSQLNEKIKTMLPPAQDAKV
jgi:Zn-dependent alcohol dehydrogenase